MSNLSHLEPHAEGEPSEITLYDYLELRTAYYGLTYLRQAGLEEEEILEYALPMSVLDADPKYLTDPPDGIWHIGIKLLTGQIKNLPKIDLLIANHLDSQQDTLMESIDKILKEGLAKGLETSDLKISDSSVNSTFQERYERLITSFEENYPLIFEGPNEIGLNLRVYLFGFTQDSFIPFEIIHKGKQYDLYTHDIVNILNVLFTSSSLKLTQEEIKFIDELTFQGLIIDGSSLFHISKLPIDGINEKIKLGKWSVKNPFNSIRDIAAKVSEMRTLDDQVYHLMEFFKDTLLIPTDRSNYQDSIEKFKTIVSEYYLNSSDVLRFMMILHYLNK